MIPSTYRRSARDSDRNTCAFDDGRGRSGDRAEVEAYPARAHAMSATTATIVARARRRFMPVGLPLVVVTVISALTGLLTDT